MIMSIVNRFDEKFKQRQTSYKMVTVLALLENVTTDGSADFDNVVNSFLNFYLDRQEKGKNPEIERAKMSIPEQLSSSQIKNTILKGPVTHLEELIEFDPENNQIKFSDNTYKDLNQNDNRMELKKVAYKHLYQYYKNIDNNWIKLEDLSDLDRGYPVNANDISSLSEQNSIKGIHPVDSQEFQGTIILCTISGQEYPNEWLDANKQFLKYYLEGRRDKNTGIKKYNQNSKNNQSVIKSKEEGYPILAFVRYSKNSYFYYEGQFVFEEIRRDEQEHPYFVLKRQDQASNEIEFNQSVNTWESMNFITEDNSEYNGYSEYNSFDVESLNEVYPHIISFIRNRGFVFSDDLIKNFLLALKSKPFVILAGLSGTGKSKLVELVANSLGATRENGQFTLIPVRPDWNDSTDLLGYKNLQGDFIEGELTKVIRKAKANQDHPYIVCLDEMNLARVEYYFSDILSVMETRKKQGERIITAPMHVEGLDDSLTFPDNLYIVGTVNMDETTHSFSPKVLDRANTIEFNEVNLDYLPDHEGEEILPKKAHNNIFKTEYIKLKDCYYGNEDFIKQQVEFLKQLNSILNKPGLQLQIGYRIRDEFCFYLLNNNKFKLLPENTAKDFQIMQKILPRIQGSSLKIESVLKELIELCSDSLPHSKEKAEFMLERFEEDGFTSFWL